MEVKDTITAEVNRELVRKYFEPFPAWAVWFIFFALCSLGAWAVMNGAGDQDVREYAPIAPVVGGVFLLSSIIGFVSHSGRPTDAQMDEWLKIDLDRLRMRALEKCGVDESQCVAPPAPVWGPRLLNTGGAQAMMKCGKDGVIRYSPVDYNALNFGQDQLLSYQCSYDLTTGNFLAESTDEYFYNDVVSVSTKTDTTGRQVEVGLGRLRESVQLKTSESFILTTAGGTSIEVFLSDPALLDLKATRGGELLHTPAEQTIQSVRRMLRDKKSSGSSAVPPVPPVQPLPPMRESAPSSGGDHAVKLRKLKQLLDEGLIDKEEFQSEKKKVLQNL